MRKKLIELLVNGERREVAVKGNDTLLELLREKLGLVGTKEACGVGECGACTVLKDGKPVLSCLTLAADAAGSDINTIEGLAQGDELDPIQDAFIRHGAVQCGFCTPGMILTAKELLAREKNPGKTQIRQAISGNLCRCTGYVKIVEAVQAAGRGDGHE
jgi:carbon-monoxide dehydrogenase small subunit